MKRPAVFIYGFKGGDKRFGDYLPDLAASDPRISDAYKIMSFPCHFGLFRHLLSKKRPHTEILVRRLRKKLLRETIDPAKAAFICHGIGGIVARRYVVDEILNQQPFPGDRILMFASPNHPADLKRMSDSLSWKDFLGKDICRHPDSLEKLNREWEANDLKKKIAVKYVLGERDAIIDKQEATARWGTGHFENVAQKNHWEVFTPETYEDPVYVITRQFLLAEAPVEKKYPENLGAIANILNWDLDPSQLESARNDLIHLVDFLVQLPWRSRQLLCTLIQKADHIHYGEMVVEPMEAAKAMGVTVQDLKAELDVLKQYNLAYMKDDPEFERISLKWPDEKWLVWDQLRGYCQKTGIGLRRFIVDLQFDLLDSKKRAS